MSADLKSMKRKSAGEPTAAAKKVKVAKSIDKPTPLKSALKKSKEEPVAVTSKVPAKKSSKTSTEMSIEAPASREIKGVVPDTEDIGTDLTPDQTAALLAGFSSSENEASDAEGGDGVALSKIPNVPTTAAIQQQVKDATSTDDPETTPGVVYIGRIPHGFYEHQMRAYFSQFGAITRLKLARNRRTGHSKHYAFLEFASAAVADIVAKTMDKYLLFGHILQVRRVPREQVGEGMFMGGERRLKVMPRNIIEGGKLRRGMVRERWEKRVEKENERRAGKTQKLRELGYEFEMPAVKAVSDVPVPQSKEVEVPFAAIDGEVGGGVKLLEGVDVQAEAGAPLVQGVGAPETATVSEKSTVKKRPAADGAKLKKAKEVKKVA